jgi:hypothetical protein
LVRRTHRWRHLLIVVACFVAALWGGTSAAAGPADNLLAGLSPVSSQRVRRTHVLTDGRAARIGGYWKTTATAQLDSLDSFVVYDLGQERKIGAVWLQGDSNDVYDVSGSKDGTRYETIFRANPVSDVGMRSRYADGLGATARYIRLTPLSGDGAFSISELQVFGESPERFPPAVTEVSGAPLERRVRDATLLFGFALIGLVVLAYRGAPRWWLLVPTLLTLLAAYFFFDAVRDAWPLGNREISTVRCTFALVATVAILRETFFPARIPAHRGAVLSALAVSATLSFMAFYNLGHPQFWDNRRGEWTFVHYLDLRQYYPTAKYFPELGYRGMYEADVAAYVEDQRVNLDSLQTLPMRDLSDLRGSTVGDQRAGVESVKKKFSPERWQEYKRDAAYFRESMGTPHYLEMMNDMGGNATPVWMGIAHILFSFVHAGNTAFLVTALLDPLLLLGAFLAIGRTFGVRTSLACMVIFGANDFIMYGTNWAGATLRHDWLAYIALGACAVRSKRYALGGALFALSATIRAFPALTLIGATLPASWWMFDYVRKNRKLPSLTTILAEQKPTVRLLLGAAATLTVLFGFSALVLSPEAWIDWASKVGQLSSDPHANHISLRSLIAGWGDDQGAVVRARMPIFLGAILCYIGAVVLTARRMRPEQAAVLALVLVPVLFYPANYYIHLVCFLPLVISEKDAEGKSQPLGPVDGAIAMTLVGMCAAQFIAVLITDNNGIHFYLNGVLLFFAITTMLIVLLRAEARAMGWYGASSQE